MKLLYTTIAASLAATTAFAGGYTPAVDAPEPVVAPVVTPVETGGDWTGGYVGLQYGQGDLDADYPGFTYEGQMFPAESDTFDVDGYGLHAGYMKDFGKFVAGGELDYNRLEVSSTDENADLWRLRGRAGYDLGRWLPYATLGMAHLSADEVSENGVSYGLGVDYKVTEQFTVGAEYTWAPFDLPGNSINGVQVGGEGDGDLDLIQIRGSYHF